MYTATWKKFGPVVLSALSFGVTALLLQSGLRFFDPTFSLLASKGSGKIVCTILVMGHALCLALSQSRRFFHQWYKQTIGFLIHESWGKTFGLFFVSFFSLHVLFLYLLVLGGYVHIDLTSRAFVDNIVLSSCWGFIATFLLAWTEELIFRGTLFPFFQQYLSLPFSIVITSFIFMAAHDLTNPFRLLMEHRPLGIGLFLLGMLLNTIFAYTQKLYASMGVHAGLVFVKVLLRRAPIITFPVISQLSWWLHPDLRQAPLVHVLFASATAVCAVLLRRKIVRNSAIIIASGRQIVKPSKRNESYPQVAQTIADQRQRNTYNR